MIGAPLLGLPQVCPVSLTSSYTKGVDLAGYQHLPFTYFTYLHMADAEGVCLGTEGWAHDCTDEAEVNL